MLDLDKAQKAERIANKLMEAGYVLASDGKWEHKDREPTWFEIHWMDAYYEALN